MDPTSRDDPRLVDAVRSHTDLLLGTARALDDATAPSLCVGWSRGHVLTHLARNGDGMAALVRTAVDGTGETMYLSDQARDADIDAGAPRPLPVGPAGRRARAHRLIRLSRGRVRAPNRPGETSHRWLAAAVRTGSG